MQRKPANEDAASFRLGDWRHFLYLQCGQFGPFRRQRSAILLMYSVPQLRQTNQASLCEDGVTSSGLRAFLAGCHSRALYGSFFKRDLNKLHPFFRPKSTAG